MEISIMDKTLNYVVFTKTAKPTSDYEIEKRYHEIKNFKYCEISSLLLLYRFRLGVKREEIQPFNITVIDFDKTQYTGIITKINTWPFTEHIKILDLKESYIMELWN